MNGRDFWKLRGVSNDDLEASLAGLLGAGARVEARIVAHLAEVETRRLHLLVGCSSLYDYCHKRLGLSDYEAFTRIAAARVARTYPIVFEMLERRFRAKPSYKFARSWHVGSRRPTYQQAARPPLPPALNISSRWARYALHIRD